MAVEPIKNDKENDIFTSAVASSKHNKEQQAAVANAGSQLKKELPKVGMHGAASPRIYADEVDPEEAVKEYRENPLSNKEVVSSINIFGAVYQKEELASHLDEIVEKLFEQFRSGDLTQTRKILKSLPKELQSKILEKIIALLDKKDNETGVNAFVKKVFNDSKVVEFCKKLMADQGYGANFSKDQKEKFLEELAKKEPAKIYQGLVSWAEKVRDVFAVAEGPLEKAGAVIAKDTNQLSRMTDRLKNKKNISDTTLAVFDKKLKKMALILKHAKLKIADLRKMGKEAEADALENIVITMEAQFNEFMNAAEEYKTGLSDEKQVAAIDKILARAKELRDENMMRVADYLKERANEGVVIALKKEAYDAVNSVIFLDKEMFCANTEIKSEDIAGIFADNYELSQELNNLKIANSFVSKTVNEIVEKDREARRAMRDQLLADLQEVEKFYEQFQKKLKEEEKKIAKITQQKAITAIDLNVREYTNIVRDLIDLKDANLEWYKCQLDTTKQKKIYSIISDLSIT